MHTTPAEVNARVNAGTRELMAATGRDTHVWKVRRCLILPGDLSPHLMEGSVR